MRYRRRGARGRDARDRARRTDLVQTTFRREDRDVAVVTGPASPAHDARVSPIVRGATTCARASFHQPATSASKKRTDFHHCFCSFRPVWSRQWKARRGGAVVSTRTLPSLARVLTTRFYYVPFARAISISIRARLASDYAQKNSARVDARARSREPPAPRRRRPPLK